MSIEIDDNAHFKVFRWQILKRPVESFKGKHLFVLPSGLYSKQNIKEIKATADGLRALNLFNLPYKNNVYIQLSYDEARSFGGTSMKWPLIVGPYGLNQKNDVRVYPRRGGWFSMNDFENPPETEPFIENVKEVLIVLLATKNVEKQKIDIQVPRKISPNVPVHVRFSYITTITVNQSLRTSKLTGMPMIPHLRRGHIRNQRYGPGNSYTKQRWIEPVFVNADENFVNNRQAYNVSLHA